jgi:6-phosphogluconate dehydrogenase
MVHNGIEYGIMETIAEAYDIMSRGLGMAPQEMADVFGDWNKGELSSYLFEITERILRRIDPKTGRPLVELILDKAAQKGTGKWSTQSALDLGTPTPTIAMAVFARIISALKAERERAASLLPGPKPGLDLELKDLFSAVRLTVLTAYAQGFRQLRDASHERGYNLDLSTAARVWMAGCIIRAKVLTEMGRILQEGPNISLLFLTEPFTTAWKGNHAGLRRTVGTAHVHGIPVPAMDSVLDFLDAYRSPHLPANLIQAQRDFFGAHTYKRVDKAGTFHTHWEE